MSRWPSNISWTNVRPISEEREANALAVFNSIDVCFRATAWARFDHVAAPERKWVTIICGRCRAPHSYFAYSPAAGRRKYCDACVRTPSAKTAAGMETESTDS
jgi:hypothetical protein